MKPHLKLDISGRLTVVRPGALNWTGTDARMRITDQYGTLKDFAARFGLPYWAVVNATTGSDGRESGHVAHVRQVLGLPSTPTFRAKVAAQAKARQRGEGEPDWVFGVEAQP